MAEYNKNRNHYMLINDTWFGGFFSQFISLQERKILHTRFCFEQFASLKDLNISLNPDQSDLLQLDNMHV